MSLADLKDPWRSFLREIDQRLQKPLELHCLGGFVVSELYGLSRTTADIDVLVANHPAELEWLARVAGRGSPLHTQFGVYIDVVPVAKVPEDYEARLTDYPLPELRHLRIRALERHDLALAKLERNLDRDRDDVKAMAAGPGLDVRILKHRYHEELRLQLGRPEREDLTLKLWVEMISEMQGGAEP